MNWLARLLNKQQLNRNFRRNSSFIWSVKPQIA